MRAPARCRDGNLAVFQALVSNNRIGKNLAQHPTCAAGLAGWVPDEIEEARPALPWPTLT